MTAAPNQALDVYLVPAFERKATSITAIDVRNLTSYADTIIIIEAASHRQVTSMADHMIKRLKDHKIKPLGKEGIKEGEWALLDYGDVIIHVFESRAKSTFNIEGLWADAPRIDLTKYTNHDGHGETGADEF